MAKRPRGRIPPAPPAPNPLPPTVSGYDSDVFQLSPSPPRKPPTKIKFFKSERAFRERLAAQEQLHPTLPVQAVHPPVRMVKRTKKAPILESVPSTTLSSSQPASNITKSSLRSAKPSVKSTTAAAAVSKAPMPVNNNNTSSYYVSTFSPFSYSFAYLSHRFFFTVGHPYAIDSRVRGQHCLAGVFVFSACCPTISKLNFCCVNGSQASQQQSNSVLLRKSLLTGAPFPYSFAY